MTDSDIDAAVGEQQTVEQRPQASGQAASDAAAAAPKVVQPGNGNRNSNGNRQRRGASSAANDEGSGGAANDGNESRLAESDAPTAAREALSDIVAELDAVQSAKEDVRKVATELQDLRDKLEGTDYNMMLDTTVDAVRVPFPAAAILHAKRAELQRLADKVETAVLQMRMAVDRLLERAHLPTPDEMAGVADERAAVATAHFEVVSAGSYEEPDEVEASGEEQVLLGAIEQALSEQALAEEFAKELQVPQDRSDRIPSPTFTPRREAGERNTGDVVTRFAKTGE